MTRRTRSTVLTLTGLAALTLACAKEPLPEIEGARNSLQALQTSDAVSYAPQALTDAQDAMALLDAELKAQQDKFAMFRSYDKTTQLAAAAKSTAERGLQQAETAKEEARNQAATMLAELKTNIEEIKTLMAEAPKGKGTQADLAALGSDLQQVEVTLTEADTAFAAGSYREASAKLEAAKQGGERIKSDIVAAIEARKAARGRRG